MIWLIISLILERAQLKFAVLTRSIGGEYSAGIGTVDVVNRREALSPMAYRVLIPWSIALIERLVPWTRKHRFTLLYEPMKIASMALLLFVVDQILGREQALWLAVLMVATFHFEYWDWAIELLGFALALSGDIHWALVGGLLVALSRETAPLIALVYMWLTGDVGRGLQVLSAILAVMLIVRLWVGHRELYCDRFMLRQNISDLRNLARDNRPVYTGELTMSLLVTGLTVWAAWQRPPAWPFALLFLVMGWLMARAGETRVFAPCLLWVAMVL